MSKIKSNNWYGTNFHHQGGNWPQSYGHYLNWLIKMLKCMHLLDRKHIVCVVRYTVKEIQT